MPDTVGEFKSMSLKDSQNSLVVKYQDFLGFQLGKASIDGYLEDKTVLMNPF